MSCAYIVQYFGYMRLYRCSYAVYWMLPDDKLYTLVFTKAAGKLKPRNAAYWSASGVSSLFNSIQSLLTLSYIFMHMYVTLVLKRTTEALNVLNKANSCHETA